MAKNGEIEIFYTISKLPKIQKAKKQVNDCDKLATRFAQLGVAQGVAYTKFCHYLKKYQDTIDEYFLETLLYYLEKDISLAQPHEKLDKYLQQDKQLLDVAENRRQISVFLAQSEQAYNYFITENNFEQLTPVWFTVYPGNSTHMAHLLDISSDFFNPLGIELLNQVMHHQDDALFETLHSLYDSISDYLATTPAQERLKLLSALLEIYPITHWRNTTLDTCNFNQYLANFATLPYAQYKYILDLVKAIATRHDNYKKVYEFYRMHIVPPGYDIKDFLYQTANTNLVVHYTDIEKLSPEACTELMGASELFSEAEMAVIKENYENHQTRITHTINTAVDDRGAILDSTIKKQLGTLKDNHDRAIKTFRKQLNEYCRTRLKRNKFGHFRKKNFFTHPDRIEAFTMLEQSVADPDTTLSDVYETILAVEKQIGLYEPGHYREGLQKYCETIHTAKENLDMDVTNTLNTYIINISVEHGNQYVAYYLLSPFFVSLLNDYQIGEIIRQNPVAFHSYPDSIDGKSYLFEKGQAVFACDMLRVFHPKLWQKTIYFSFNGTAHYVTVAQAAQMVSADLKQKLETHQAADPEPPIDTHENNKSENNPPEVDSENDKPAPDFQQPYINSLYISLTEVMKEPQKKIEALFETYLKDNVEITQKNFFASEFYQKVSTTQLFFKATIAGAAVHEYVYNQAKNMYTAYQKKYLLAQEKQQIDAALANEHKSRESHYDNVIDTLMAHRTDDGSTLLFKSPTANNRYSRMTQEQLLRIRKSVCDDIETLIQTVTSYAKQSPNHRQFYSVGDRESREIEAVLQEYIQKLNTLNEKSYTQAFLGMFHKLGSFLVGLLNVKFSPANGWWASITDRHINEKASCRTQIQKILVHYLDIIKTGRLSDCSHQTFDMYNSDPDNHAEIFKQLHDELEDLKRALPSMVYVDEASAQTTDNPPNPDADLPSLETIETQIENPHTSERSQAEDTQEPSKLTFSDKIQFFEKPSQNSNNETDTTQATQMSHSNVAQKCEQLKHLFK